MKRPPIQRAGFALITMMIVLILAGVFMLVAARLMTQILRTTRQAQEAHMRAVRLDGMIDQLRSDVWQAATLQTPDRTSAILGSGESAVNWSIGADGNPTRKARSTTAVYHGLGSGLAFETRGANLVVKLTQADELVLTSQAMLAGGSR